MIDSQTQTRSSSEASYLWEVLVETTDLAVYKNTMAKRVLLDESKQACAAIVDSDGVTYRINTTKEVIIPAGAVCKFREPLQRNLAVGMVMTVCSFVLLRLSVVNGFGDRAKGNP